MDALYPKPVSKKPEPTHDLLILSGWFDRRKTTADITGHCRKRRRVTARPAKKKLESERNFP
ncbi:MAG: hypothetical protein VB137_01780 [Burkholderia sp.]